MRNPPIQYRVTVGGWPVGPSWSTKRDAEAFVHSLEVAHRGTTYEIEHRHIVYGTWALTTREPAQLEERPDRPQITGTLEGFASGGGA